MRLRTGCLATLLVQILWDLNFKILNCLENLSFKNLICLWNWSFKILLLRLLNGLSICMCGRDEPQWALVLLLKRLLHESSRFHFPAVGMSLDTSAAFASVTGGAALRFLFEGLGVLRGVEDLQCSGRRCGPAIGKHVAREHQVAIPGLHQVVHLGTWGHPDGGVAWADSVHLQIEAIKNDTILVLPNDARDVRVGQHWRSELCECWHTFVPIQALVDANDEFGIFVGLLRAGADSANA